MNRDEGAIRCEQVSDDFFGGTFVLDDSRRDLSRASCRCDHPVWEMHGAIGLLLLLPLSTHARTRDEGASFLVGNSYA